MNKICFLLFYITVIWGVNGCAIINPIKQESTLYSAADKIKKGDVNAAIVLLEETSSKDSVPGITDEALFRLGLLYLDQKPRAKGLTKARNVFERLNKEYPGSEWNILSTPLLKYLKEMTSAQRKIEKLEETNTSILKENKKLKIDIERLKTFDLEIEQKQSP
ncbi:MAG: hypothetical protein IT392_09955 [Nitrospirae bacterium]|nr:hypothetical protein [Nitrospirota bacterium]